MSANAPSHTEGALRYRLADVVDPWEEKVSSTDLESQVCKDLMVDLVCVCVCMCALVRECAYLHARKAYKISHIAWVEGSEVASSKPPCCYWSKMGFLHSCPGPWCTDSGWIGCTEPPVESFKLYILDHCWCLKWCSCSDVTTDTPDARV